jgi:hypothetical protein
VEEFLLADMTAAHAPALETGPGLAGARAARKEKAGGGRLRAGSSIFSSYNSAA